MKVNKRIGKLKQWTGEKLGGQQKTELSDDLQSLEQDVSLRKSGVEKMYSVSMEYSKYLSKKYEADGTDTGKVSPAEGLGLVLAAHGEEFGHDSAFGQALTSFGKAQQQIASATANFTDRMNAGWLTSLEKSLAQMSEYTNQRKKLDSRRLSYDAMLAKVQKSKKEKRDLEDDLRIAKNRYEETSAEVYERAIAIQDSEADQMTALTRFLEIQFSWVDQQKRILDNLQRNWVDLSKDSPSAKSKTLRDIGSEYGSKNHTKRNVPSLERRLQLQDPDDRLDEDRPTGENINSDDGDYEEREQDYGSKRQSRSATYSVVKARLPPSPREALIAPERTSVSNSSERYYGAKLPGFPAADPKRSARSSNAPQAKWMKAKWAYNTGELDELKFEFGDRIKVLNEINSEWLFGNNEATGQSGMFPAAYCIQDHPEASMSTSRARDTFADPDEHRDELVGSERDEEDELQNKRSVSGFHPRLASRDSTRSVGRPPSPPSSSPNTGPAVGKRAPPPPPTRRATTANANSKLSSSTNRKEDQPEPFGSVKELKKRLGMTE